MNSERSLLDGLIFYASILLRRKWLIIKITAAATIAAILFCAASILLPPDKSPLPNVYSAEAIIHIQNNTQSDIAGSILGALGVDQRNSSQMSFDNGDLVLEILRSRSILDRLNNEFNLSSRYKISDKNKGKTREALLDRFRWNYFRNTGSIHILYSETDPVLAKNIVNRMVELLSEWFVMNRGLARQKTKQILEEKLTEVKADIESLQNRLKNLQKRYGVLNAEELGVSQASSLANLRSQLIMKEIEIKNYSIYSKINDPRLEQLMEEQKNLKELISQNQMNIPDASLDNVKQRSIADVAQEFSQLTTELDIQQRIYNTLSPQFEAAKLAPESEPIFQVFEMAEVPDMKSGPLRTRLILMVMGGAFAASIAFILCLNMWETLSKDPEKKKLLSALR